MVDLNQINSKFDLNNLDAEKIAQSLTQHQHTLIKSGLIIVSLVLIVMMFNDHRAKEAALQTQMSQAQAKIEALKPHDQVILDFKNFKSSLPEKLTEFQLVTVISDYAKSIPVSIGGLSPTESKDMGLYDVMNVSFDVVADNFKTMLLFIRKIEKSKYPLRIDSWRGGQGSDGKINFSLSISAVMVHS